MTKATETKDKSHAIATDYSAARQAAKSGNIREVVLNLLSAQISLREEHGVTQEGEAQMPHIFRLIDQANGYDTPTMGSDENQKSWAEWFSGPSPKAPKKKG